MRYSFVISSLVLLFMLCLARPAAAVLQFCNAFTAEYLEHHPDQAYAEYVKKEVKCLVCHQGKKRKNHNRYGEHLDELLDRKKDAKDLEKIVAALKKVAALPFDPADPNSETFAQR